MVDISLLAVCGESAKGIGDEVFSRKHACVIIELITHTYIHIYIYIYIYIF